MTGGEREEEEMAVRAAVMETVAHRQEELQVAELTMLRVWVEVSRMDRIRKKKIRGIAQVQQSCSQTVCWMLQKLTQCVSSSHSAETNSVYNIITGLLIHQRAGRKRRAPERFHKQGDSLLV